MFSLRSNALKLRNSTHSQFISTPPYRVGVSLLAVSGKDINTGKPSYIDYLIELPPRSVNEFFFWLQQYSNFVTVIYPDELRLLQQIYWLFKNGKTQ